MLAYAPVIYANYSADSRKFPRIEVKGNL